VHRKRGGRDGVATSDSKHAKHVPRGTKPSANTASNERKPGPGMIGGGPRSMWEACRAEEEGMGCLSENSEY
jgi:hypothetical protein